MSKRYKNYILYDISSVSDRSLSSFIIQRLAQLSCHFPLDDNTEKNHLSKTLCGRMVKEKEKAFYRVRYKTELEHCSPVMEINAFLI